MTEQRDTAPSAATTLQAPAGPLTEKVNFAYHGVIGVAIGVVAVFTALAWPFAILTGVVIGSSEVDRMLDRPQRGFLLKVLAVTGGVLMMLVAGAILGGLIAFTITALMAFSERISARANDTDRVMARLVTILVAVAAWVVAVMVLRLNVAINFGGPPPA
jgi:hypothetical protein